MLQSLGSTLAKKKELTVSSREYRGLPNLAVADLMFANRSAENCIAFKKSSDDMCFGFPSTSKTEL